MKTKKVTPIKKTVKKVLQANAPYVGKKSNINPTVAKLRKENEHLKNTVEFLNDIPAQPKSGLLVAQIHDLKASINEKVSEIEKLQQIFIENTKTAQDDINFKIDSLKNFINESL